METENQTAVETAGPGPVLDLATLPADALIDADTLAGSLKICERTLRRLVRSHALPPPVRLGAKRVWLAGRVLDWIKARSEREEQAAQRELARIHRLGT